MWGLGIARNVSETRLVNQRTLNPTGYSLLYTSPEVFSRLALRNFNPEVEEEKKADVYSFAIIAFECLNKKKAWEDIHPNDIESYVRSGNRPECNPDLQKDKIRKEIYDIMVAAWSGEPSKRPSFDEIRDKLLRYKGSTS